MSGQVWSVVVPAKSLAHAKSRMSEASLPPSAFASAFLADVLVSVLASTAVHEVIVATGDPEASTIAGALGARVMDDSGHEGINAAVTAAARQADARARIAVVVSDLPRLTTSALDHVLEAGLAHETSFVADRAGTGTTIWLAASATLMPPAYGEGSRARHRAAGAVDLVALRGGAFCDLILSARCDVDTQADLTAPGLPPLGPRTRALLESSGVVHGS